MKNLLVIVDDLRLRSAINNSPIASIFHTIFANNAWEGIRLAQEQYPDLILTDLNVLNPEKYKFFQEVRQISFVNKIPIILLTQQIDIEFFLKVWELGIYLYFLKTVDIYFLIKVMFCQLRNGI